MMRKRLCRPSLDYDPQRAHPTRKCDSWRHARQRLGTSRKPAVDSLRVADMPPTNHWGNDGQPAAASWSFFGTGAELLGRGVQDARVGARALTQSRGCDEGTGRVKSRYAKKPRTVPDWSVSRTGGRPGQTLGIYLMRQRLHVDRVAELDESRQDSNKD